MLYYQKSVLKATKPIKAYTEIMITFGKITWMSTLRAEWTNTTVSPNNYPIIIKNAICANEITEEEAIIASTNHRIQELIIDFINNHMTWQTGIHYFVNILPNIHKSCLINSMFILKTHNNRLFIIPAHMVCSTSGVVFVKMFDFIPMKVSKK